MIITHADADGWCSAGIFLLTKTSKKTRERIKTVRYATVRYINILLEQILRNQNPYPLFIFDLNADDTETYKNLLIKLASKGFKITLIDHHIVPENFDKFLIENGIKVIRDTSICCSELVYRKFKDEIPKNEQNKAEFLMCIGAIGDKRITDFIKKKMFSFRWEELFDLYAVLIAGIRDGKEFLNSILIEKDRDGVGFTKKLYNRAARKRFWLEKIKRQVLNKYELINDKICVIHIFKKYLGLAASILIEELDVKYVIAIGDRPPDNIINKIILFIKQLLKPFFIKKNRPKGNKMIRISIRSTKPINNIIKKLAKDCGGFGGGHKFACGVRIPNDKLNTFLKKFVKEVE